MSEEVGWGDTMTFRLWMNMYPHDCPHFTGGDLEAAYNALEAAYNAGVGHATTRATAAERERIRIYAREYGMDLGPVFVTLDRIDKMKREEADNE